MPKFAANLSMMFTELPFLDRFEAAADAGFAGAEFLLPYEHSPEVVMDRSRAAGIEIILFNMPPGDWASGERGITCLPGREDEFRRGVEKAITYARIFGARQVHAMAGIVPAGADPAVCRSTLIENLRYAAEKVGAYEITLLLEAINTRDMPNFIVSTQKESHEICEAVNAANLRMQMDLYHMQVMEGDLAWKLKKYSADCGHVQIAGCPERNEPDSGEVRYEYLLSLLDDLGYQGWVGCEYRPAGKTLDGLGWMDSFGAAKVV